MSDNSVFPPLGLDFLSVPGAHPVEHIEAAAANGFTSVGLRVEAPTGLQLDHDILNDSRMIRDIKTALKRTGIKVLDVEAFTISKTSHISKLEPAFELSAELGVGIFQAVVEDPDINRARDRFIEMCQLAARYEMVIALEFMKWRTLKSIQETWNFISVAGQPNAGICIDCLHLSRCGDSPRDVASLPPESISYVQLCDAVAELPPLDKYIEEARGGRLYPGEGSLWLHDLLDVLPADVPVTIEVPRMVDAGKSVTQRAEGAAEAMRRFYMDRKTRS